MLTRRRFIGCAICAAATSHTSSFGARAEDDGWILFCASAATAAEVQFHPIDEIDWSGFFVSAVPTIVDTIGAAYQIRQNILFSDEAVLRQSYNKIWEADYRQSRMCIGVGNLGDYSVSTLIAVILHEISHCYSYVHLGEDELKLNMTTKQRELLADFLAGSGYRDIERQKLTYQETVYGQCPYFEPPINEWVELYQPPEASASPPPPTVPKVPLDPRKLRQKKQGAAQFYALRENGAIDAIYSQRLIGPTPDEDPNEDRCLSVLGRSVDFRSMAEAVTSWRTFGDYADTPSHGSPAERYTAFRQGYEARASGTLIDSLGAGRRYVEALK